MNNGGSHLKLLRLRNYCNHYDGANKLPSHVIVFYFGLLCINTLKIIKLVII